ncbi:MAG: hypothetical protein ACPKPY_05960 [Nitrososphaeraceae archaeon]
MELKKIDSVFTTTRENLEDIIKDYEFELKFEFVLNGNFDYSLLEKLCYSGIYKFEIATCQSPDDLDSWINEFRELWETKEFKKRFVPNITKKRLKAHNVLPEWLPIYIGKHKLIKRRIKEHLDLDLTRPTFALKLHERKNLYGRRFRVSTIKVDVKNYDLIVSEFENYFRGKINPILGR